MGRKSWDSVALTRKERQGTPILSFGHTLCPRREPFSLDDGTQDVSLDRKSSGQRDNICVLLKANENLEVRSGDYLHITVPVFVFIGTQVRHLVVETSFVETYRLKVSGVELQTGDTTSDQDR